MPHKPQPIWPAEKAILIALGERLKLARLRRKISAETLAARSSITRMTLHRAEKGSPAVQMGTYVRILAALRLLDDLNLIAGDDPFGRQLQDLELTKGKQS